MMRLDVPGWVERAQQLLMTVLLLAATVLVGVLSAALIASILARGFVL